MVLDSACACASPATMGSSGVICASTVSVRAVITIPTHS